MWQRLVAQYHKYGATPNSHDAIKFFALIVMTVDHLGAFIWPGALWLRAIGRFSFPVWFFLAGYMPPLRIKADIVVLGLLLVLVSAFTFQPIFPLNALVSYLICCFAVRVLDRYSYLTERPWELVIVALALMLPTSILFEYGMQAILYAAMGYMVRCNLRAPKHMLFYATCWLMYCTLQQAAFKFSLPLVLLVTLGSGIITYQLTQFTLKPLALAPEAATAIVMKALARNSLYYYAIHRAVLQIAGIWAMTPQARHFTWLIWK